MEFLTTLLQALFEQTGIDPQSITELEIEPGAWPDVQWIRITPDPGWHAYATYYAAGHWWVEQRTHL